MKCVNVSVMIRFMVLLVVGFLPLGEGFENFYMASAAAQTAKGPAMKGTSVRPSPSFKGPVIRPRPMPLRPRPSVGMTRPMFNHGQGIRPTPVRPRPSVGMTRPNYNNGQGIRPIPVRPKPSNPYPDYPDFVDTPQMIDDLKPIRPPIQKPPHHRPPHWMWGDWYWYGNIGWYHRLWLDGATVIIVDSLPPGCRTRIRQLGKTYYKCNGVYYSGRIVRGERVYQIVSIEDASDAASSLPVLRLTRPYMRGPRVLELQQLLQRRGYNVNTPDGIFGRVTERALKRFQRDVDVSPDGVAKESTFALLQRK